MKNIRSMDLDVNELFKEPCDVEGMTLDIDIPKTQMAITSLPDDFQIKTMTDIRTLQEVVALNYAKGINLYRGHESQDYIIESTIVRLLRQKNQDCSVQDENTAEPTPLCTKPRIFIIEYLNLF
jgi:hypothetical protein